MKLLATISTLLLVSAVFAQDTASSYQNLQRKKIYHVQLYTSSGVTTTYKINNTPVDETTYENYKDKLEAGFSNISSCKPCILQEYLFGDTLKSETVSYFGCPVGWFREYYPNGNVKIAGQYKENSTGNWNKLDYCGVEVGRWVYFKPNGDTAYSEYWDEGKFVKQVPEQDSCEVWALTLTLDGAEITEVTKLQPEDIPRLVLKPSFKNQNTSAKWTYKLEVKTPGNYPWEFDYTAEQFQTLDLRKVLAKNKIKAKDNPKFILHILNYGQELGSFPLNIQLQ